jgi:hypothetical protein
MVADLRYADANVLELVAKFTIKQLLVLCLNMHCKAHGSLVQARQLLAYRAVVLGCRFVDMLPCGYGGLCRRHRQYGHGCSGGPHSKSRYEQYAAARSVLPTGTCQGRAAVRGMHCR